MVTVQREGSRSSITHSEVWGLAGDVKVYIRYRDGVVHIREGERWTDHDGFISPSDASVDNRYEIGSGQFAQLKMDFDDWNDVLSETEYELDDPKF